jgi:hypothetical protein
MAESPEIAIRALLPFCARQRQMSFVEGRRAPKAIRK